MFPACSMEVFVKFLSSYRQVPFLLYVVPRWSSTYEIAKAPSPPVVNGADCLWIWTDRFLCRTNKLILWGEISIRRGSPLLRML